MSDDPLKNETGFSIAVTETGLDLKAKSRTISAVDRFFGGIFDRFNPIIERPAQLKRAIAAREDRIEDAITDKMIEAVHADPDIGQRALSQYLGVIGRKFDNKSAVVTLALEDLRENPPSEAQSASGPPELDPDFTNRFERYAEDATSDQLRERWGRVLAAEVRVPGTFSQKVLRAVDELDAETARLFERVASYRLHEAIPIGVMGELKFSEKIQLVEAGLLVDPGAGNQIRLSSPVEQDDAKWLFLPFRDKAIAISEERESMSSGKFLSTDTKGNPVVPIYILSKAGSAIASIIPHDDGPTFLALTQGILDEIDRGEVRTYIHVYGDQWEMTGQHQKPTPAVDEGGLDALGGFQPS